MILAGIHLFSVMAEYCSFVVRFWADDNHRTVRGHIRHVGTEDNLRFTDMKRMVTFIENHMEVSVSQAPEPHLEEREGRTND